MTDDLIARLRSPSMGRSTILEAADALEAKDKRIEQQNYLMGLASKHRDELEERIAALEALLKECADELADYAPRGKDDALVCAARAAMEGKE